MVLAIGPSRLNADVGMLAGSSSWKWKWIPRSVVDRDTLSRRGRQTVLAKPMTQVLILFFWSVLGLYHSQMNMGRYKVLGHEMYPVMRKLTSRGGRDGRPMRKDSPPESVWRAIK